MTTTFKINGMHCPACTKLITKRLSAISGVTAAQVDLTTGSATVDSNRQIKSEEVNQVLADTAYTAQ